MFKPPQTAALPNTPAAPAPPPMFGQQTMATSKVKGTQSQTPTLIGAQLAPAQTGQKTLLGQ